MDNKCFLCNEKLRSFYFPGYFKFWLERPCVLVVFIAEYGGLGYFGVCRKDAMWAYEHRLEAEVMLYAKISALEKK